MGAAALAAIGVGAYLFGHTRVNGLTKYASNTPWKANWQSVKQLLRLGDVCNPHHTGDRLCTSHSGDAILRDINLLKHKCYD